MQLTLTQWWLKYTVYTFHIDVNISFSVCFLHTRLTMLLRNPPTGWYWLFWPSSRLCLQEKLCSWGQEIIGFRSNINPP